MSTIPNWRDSEQADLLELVALGTPQGTADAEWNYYTSCLGALAALNGGIVSPNRLRAHVRGRVAPKRIAAFTSRAVARKLIEPTGGWEISDDHEGRNAGRPCRQYRWVGGAA